MKQVMESGPPQHTDEQIMEALQRCANAHVTIANTLYSCNLPYPVTIECDLQMFAKPDVGAEAHWSGKMFKIKFNFLTARTNTELVLNKIVGHEVAHLMQRSKFDVKGFPTKSHGPEWKEAMRLLGLPPEKTLEYDTTDAVAFYKANKKAINQNMKGAR